ncbi:hypothetical protein NIIDNTM18_49760 [Mycolicibacterium litorale]|uniref:Uncharacterized protein n=1 Tax=Mycolicibacterium litorale TaxID=758802 RepID=A0A6S6PIB1_9MYCO|nr:hypothetical protein [Mycolicibacterium litorale]BCI55698.1 hypothetical protein NIIDNTM18_49760 [Mycolicibacterium litorale]
MAFTIRFQDKSVKSYDDDHRLEVKDSGIIQVTKDGEQVALYSPHHWTSVTPGIPKKEPARVHRVR